MNAATMATSTTSESTSDNSFQYLQPIAEEEKETEDANKHNPEPCKRTFGDKVRGYQKFEWGGCTLDRSEASYVYIGI